MIPDDPTQDPDREQWLVKHLPRSEANILNGKAKKPTKKSKAAAAKQALAAQHSSSHMPTPTQTQVPPLGPIEPSTQPAAASSTGSMHTAPVTAAASLAVGASSSLPSAGAQPVASEGDQTALAPSAREGADAASVAVGGDQALLAPSAEAIPTPAEAALAAVVTQPEQEEEEEIVVLCPTHNPDWKAIVSARRAAKKLQDLRRRVLQLRPGTLVRFRHKGGAVWESLLLEIQDSEDSEGRIVIKDDAVGSSAMPWSRIIFPEVEAAMNAKRKVSETPECSSSSTSDAETSHKRIRLVGAHVPAAPQPRPHDGASWAASGNQINYQAFPGTPDQRMHPLMHPLMHPPPGLMQPGQPYGPTNAVVNNPDWHQPSQQAAKVVSPPVFGPAESSLHHSQQGHYGHAAAGSLPPFPQNTPWNTPWPLPTFGDQSQTPASSLQNNPAQHPLASMYTHSNHQ